jgi:hypothetical protein
MYMIIDKWQALFRAIAAQDRHPRETESRRTKDLFAAV